MRIPIIILALLFVILQYALLLSSGGLLQIWRLKHAIAAISVENANLQDRNDALVADVSDLKAGNEAIEEHARNDLGMIRKGETFYQISK